jgi:DNA-binding response OmpR family regulator
VNVLTQAQCDVLVAPSGTKGLELARENKFDLIVLAVDLPDISGLEICNELKQSHLTRHIPIVFLSGRPCEEERRRSLELGAVDYIVKPFDTADFALRLLSYVKTGNDPIAVAESTET